MAQRVDLLKKERNFVAKTWPELKLYFADGSDIVPERISPCLELVEGGTWQSDLFRLATLLWSVPVSQGYGRRMRFLVWDKSNGKLLGVIGLGDPVFNLKVRDDIIGWTSAQRKDKLVNMMEAYVLGAIPPYNYLLCGKMVACLVKTKEVCDCFSKKYSRSKGIISGKFKHAKLVAITTSSALGRSSLYNRLTLDGHRYFAPIGYTAGWGHFHVPRDLFAQMREFLAIKGHKYSDNNRYGEGPNWRLRAIRRTLSLLGLNPRLLQHGILREVFLCETASNAFRYLTGEICHVRYKGLLSATEVSRLALDRWVIPRSNRVSDYLEWTVEDTARMLKANGVSTLKMPVTRKGKMVGSG